MDDLTVMGGSGQRPKRFDLRSALAIPPENLTHRDAVLIAIELLKGASPVLARHFDTVPNVLVSFEMTLADYAPNVIRAAIERMLKSMKRETRDQIPDAFRLADYCEDVIDDRRKERREREESNRLAREEAESMAREERRSKLSATELAAEDERINQLIAKFRRESIKSVPNEMTDDEISAKKRQIRREIGA